MRAESLKQLTLARFREFIREPEAVFWTFVFPLLLAGGLAIAFRDKPPERPIIAVLSDGATAPIAAKLLSAASAPDSLIAVRTIPADSSAHVLRTGTAALVVAVNGVDSAGTPRIEYRYDPARPEARAARQAVDDALQRALGRHDAYVATEVTARDVGSRYIDFFLPGLLAMSIMGSSIWSLVFAIVTQRKQKLLKRLVATPMSRLEYLLSFVLFRLMFLGVEVAFLLGFGTLVLGVPIRGSIITVLLIAFVGAAAFGSIGLLVSSRAKTIEAASGLTNLIMMPMWITSGVFFAASNFPKVVQPVVQALPLTALVNALRAVMLQGASFTGVLPQLTLLAAYLIVCLTLALRLFRWQ